MTVVVGGIPLDILKQKKTPKKLNQVFFKLQQKNDGDGEEANFSKYEKK
jgi:hypothetical protein